MQVVEIIDEFSFDAEEELKELEVHIEEMEKDKAELRVEQLGESKRVTVCDKM